MSNDRANFLDVEDDEQRQNRIDALLRHLSTSSSSTVVSPNPVLNIGHERSPGPIEPPTELLSRVQTFLPAILASNKELDQMKPEDIDIENVSEAEEQYIEMNLGLGVFEAKPRPKSGSRSVSPSSEGDSSSDVTSSGSESDSESFRANSEEDSESDSSSDDDSDSDSDSESQSGSSVDMKPISSRLIKPLPRRVSRQTKLEV